MRFKIARNIIAITLLLAVFTTNLPAIAQPVSVPTVNAESSDRQTTEFEQNNGQFAERVKYVARSAGSMLFLTGDTAMYVLPFADNESQSMQHDREIERPMQRFHAVSMTLANANRDISATGGVLREHRTNYFKGPDAANWQTDIPNFGEVTFGNVYDGVSMVWRGRESGATQYDFVVAPNADSSHIELTFDGADNISLDDVGNLLITTPAGTLTQNKPFTYQVNEAGERVEVPSAFTIDATTARFALGAYDRSRELTIDPTVTLSNPAFSTFVGSFANDLPNEIAVDSNGNSYITGRTLSASFPTTVGTFDTTANGNEDAFVTKINAGGTGIVFSTYLGGTFFDEGLGIVVDATGYIYVAGAAGPAFPATVGAYDTTFNGGADAFVTKLSPAGSALIYSTYIGAAQIEFANDVAIDASGNAYIAVRANNGGGGAPYPTTVGAFDTTENGSDDAAVTKLDPTGSTLVYSTFLGGSSIDAPNSIVVNAAGEAFVGGSTTDDVTDFPVTAGAFDTTHNGLTDFFATRISADGSALVYSTLIGGTGIDNANSIALDAAGNAYITGTVAPGFPTTAGVFDTTAAGSNEIGLSKLNPTGTALIYSTFIGGVQSDSVDAIAVDNFGNAYIAGSNFGGDYPVTSDAFDGTFNGSNDAFLTVVNAAATGLIYSSYLGGGGSDTGTGIALDTTGNVYLTGRTIVAGASAFPTTAQAFQNFNGGGTDGFVSKFGDFSIGGRVIDTLGNPLASVMVAMSGQVSGSSITGADGRFGFTDTVAGEPHSVTATRPGYLINPSIFNIASLNANRELIFVGTPGSPSGGSGGTLLFQNLSYTRGENGSAISLTVSRTGIISSQFPITVDFQTSGGSALPLQDYQPTSGIVTFGPFETAKTITIPIVNDFSLEPRESFTVILSNPTNHADFEPGRQTATVNLLDDDLGPGDLLISEFRTRGRLGANDEYVKLFNPHDFDVTIFAADGNSGIALARHDAGSIAAIATIPNLVTIRSRGHYLLTNNSPSGGFSLIDFPTGIGTMTTAGDQTFVTNIPDSADIVLLRTSDPLQFGPANKVDSVGFAGSAWAEGNGLAPTVPANREFCYARRLSAGGFQDTNDNRSDLMLVDNHAAMFESPDQSRVVSVLGSPAPENSESLRMMTPSEVSIDQSGSEIFDPAPVENGPNGTLTVYRTITNLTASPITALRLRAIDFPTIGSFSQRRYSSRPDFRLLNSIDANGAFGLTLAAGRLQPNGGGLNSTLTVDSVTAADPLVPGESIVVAVRLGVMRWGKHPFSAAIEALQ